MRDLAEKVGDGIIPVPDLYAAYVEMTEAQGRVPVNKTALGRAIRAAGQYSTARAIDGKNVRCWVIRQKFLYWLGPVNQE